MFKKITGMFKKRTDAPLKVCDVYNKENIKIIIPETKTIVHKFECELENYKQFSQIVLKGGMKYRLNSDCSHEIMHIRGTYVKNLFNIVADPKFTIMVRYIGESISRPFDISIFVTDKGNYFVREIVGSGKVIYKLLDRKDIQNIIEEPSVTVGLHYYHVTPREIYYHKTGEYNSCNKQNGYTTSDMIVNVESYEIIDQSRYDDIIETL